MKEVHRPELLIRDHPELDNTQQVALETLIMYYNNHHLGYTAIQAYMNTLGVKEEIDLEFK